MKAIRVGIVLLFAAVVTAGTVDFTADVVKTEGNRVTKGTLHVKGGVYRMAFPDPRGPDTIYIADPANDVVRVLVPRYKLYMEDKCESMLARMQDPFLVRSMLLQHYEAKPAGTETVSGYECEKETLGKGDQVSATFWKSTKLGFHLKVQLQANYHSVVSNVKESTVDEALMKVPEGYAKADRETIGAKIEADPEMQAKLAAWKANRPVEGRVSMRLSPGAEIVVLLGKATKVTAGLPYKAPECKWTLEAMRGGTVVLEKSDPPFLGKVGLKSWEGEKVPDRIVARGVEGSGYFEVKLLGKAPLVLATRQRFAQKPHGGSNWTVNPGVKLTTIRITAESGEKNRVVGVFELSDGQGKSDRREFTLEAGQSKELKVSKEEGYDSLGYTIQHGKTRVEVVEEYRDEKDRKPF